MTSLVRGVNGPGPFERHPAPAGAAALMKLKQKQQDETMKLLQAQQAQRMALQSGIMSAVHSPSRFDLVDSSSTYTAEQRSTNHVQSVPFERSAESNSSIQSDAGAHAAILANGNGDEAPSVKTRKPQLKRPFLRKGEGLARYKGKQASKKSLLQNKLTGEGAKAEKSRTTMDNGTWDGVLGSDRLDISRSPFDLDQRSDASSMITPSQWDLKEQHERRELEEFRFLELAAAASRSQKNSPARNNGMGSALLSNNAEIVQPVTSAIQAHGSVHEWNDPIHPTVTKQNDVHQHNPSLTHHQSESDMCGDSDEYTGTEDATPQLSHFDDLDSWGDTLGDSTSDHESDKNVEPTEKDFRSRDFSTAVIHKDTTVDVDPSKSPPPQSKLVSKLFRGLSQPGTQREGKVSTPSQNSRSKREANNVVVEVSESLTERRVRDLEKELVNCKAENKRIMELLNQQDHKIKQQHANEQKFKTEMGRQRAEFESHMKNERAKLAREKKVWEKHYKAARELPNRRERQEIDQLREELAEQTQALVEAEKRYKLNIARLTDRAKDLTSQNDELAKEIRELEKLRLSAWEQTSSGSKDSTQAPHSSARAHGIRHTVGKSTNSAATLLGSNISPGAAVEIDRSSSAEMPGLSNHASVPVDTATVDSHSSLTNKKLPDQDNDQLLVSKYPNGKIEKIHPNGTKMISFADGSRKEVYADGHTIVRFYNGDIKQTFPNRQVVYFYAETQTTHTTFPDGLEVLEFANGQTEKNYPDGTQEIGFPDDTKKFIFSNGEEETLFTDGTIQRLTNNGERVIEYPNGQREVHTANYRKRRYPNGTVKIVYPDGRQETNYASGRVRVKDKDGVVIVDSHIKQK